jgi:hypothetical protein
LGIGITSDIFHTVGKYALSNVALMIDVREDSIAARQSLITRSGILSNPGTLLVAIEYKLTVNYIVNKLKG